MSVIIALTDAQVASVIEQAGGPTGPTGPTAPTGPTGPTVPVEPPLTGTDVPPWNNVAWIANHSRFAAPLTNGQANFNDVFNSFGQAAALAYFSAVPSLNSVANSGNKLHPPIDQRTQANILNAYGGQGTAGAPANMQIFSFKLAVIPGPVLKWINTDVTPNTTARINLRHPQNDNPVGT